MTTAETDRAGVAAALVEELHGEGELVEAAAGFSIDAVRALAKLREYQLADAHAYVLLLVEAAILAGAEQVEVEIGVDGVRVALEPLRLDRETLEQLFAAVFVDLDELDGPERRRRRAIQKLALAANAALRLGPSAIVIECPSPAPNDGSEPGEPSDEKPAAGLRLTLTPEASVGVVSELDGPTPARVWVQTRALAELLDDSPEARLLRAHCRYSRVPIHLDGARISESLERVLHTDLSPGELSLSVRARKLRPIELDGAPIGFAALRYGGGLRPELLLVTNGVLAETLALDEGEQPAAKDFMAIVDVDLRKDLGQAKLLRGPAFEAVLAAVWAVHDEIATRAPRTNELPSPSSLTQVLEASGTPAVLIPIVVLLFGLILLWGAIEAGGSQGFMVAVFAAVVVLGSAYAIIRAFQTP